MKEWGFGGERVVAKGEIHENGRCGSKTGHCVFKETLMVLKWSDVTTEKDLFDSREGWCGPEKRSVLWVWKMGADSVSALTQIQISIY
jgi:hypothetical protein